MPPSLDTTTGPLELIASSLVEAYNVFSFGKPSFFNKDKRIDSKIDLAANAPINLEIKYILKLIYYFLAYACQEKLKTPSKIFEELANYEDYKDQYFTKLFKDKKATQQLQFFFFSIFERNKLFNKLIGKVQSSTPTSPSLIYEHPNMLLLAFTAYCYASDKLSKTNFTIFCRQLIAGTLSIKAAYHLNPILNNALVPEKSDFFKSWIYDLTRLPLETIELLKRTQPELLSIAIKYALLTTKMAQLAAGEQSDVKIFNETLSTLTSSTSSPQPLKTKLISQLTALLIQSFKQIKASAEVICPSSLPLISEASAASLPLATANPPAKYHASLLPLRLAVILHCLLGITTLNKAQHSLYQQVIAYLQDQTKLGKLIYQAIYRRSKTKNLMITPSFLSSFNSSPDKQEWAKMWLCANHLELELLDDIPSFITELKAIAFKESIELPTNIALDKLHISQLIAAFLLFCLHQNYKDLKLQSEDTYISNLISMEVFNITTLLEKHQLYFINQAIHRPITSQQLALLILSTNHEPTVNKILQLKFNACDDTGKTTTTECLKNEKAITLLLLSGNIELLNKIITKPDWDAPILTALKNWPNDLIMSSIALELLAIKTPMLLLSCSRKLPIWFWPIREADKPFTPNQAIIKEIIALAPILLHISGTTFKQRSKTTDDDLRIRAMKNAFKAKSKPSPSATIKTTATQTGLKQKSLIENNLKNLFANEANLKYTQLKEKLTPLQIAIIIMIANEEQIDFILKDPVLWGKLITADPEVGRILALTPKNTLTKLIIAFDSVDSNPIKQFIEETSDDAIEAVNSFISTEYFNQLREMVYGTATCATPLFAATTKPTQGQELAAPIKS